MEINTSSDKTSPGISPRISFSQDHKPTVQAEDPHERDACMLDSSSDFVFCIQNGVAHKLSSADELFSNGKIVTTQINRVSIPYVPQHEPHQHHPFATRAKMLKEFLSEPDDDDDDNYDYDVVMEERPNPNSVSSFWRSSSVNCDGATRGKSVLRSSLQFLSRSYSTGSAPNTPKHVKETHRLQKQSSGSSLSLSSSSSASSSAYYYFYDSCQKPSLKKNLRNKGVRINPVLNLPHYKATRSVFGFGSLFCNGKLKGRNRKS